MATSTHASSWQHVPKVLAILVWLTGLGALWWYQTNSGLTAQDTAIALFTFITTTVWGPVLYVLMYSIRPITFFPAVALTILSGVFFGLVWGTILTIIGALGAASTAYLVGWTFGHTLHLENSPVGRWVASLRENTFVATLTTRLLFLPYDLVSYAAGILTVRFASFITGTFVGIVLGTTTFVSIGAALDLEMFVAEGFSTDVIQPQFLLMSAVIFVLSIGLSRYLKQRKHV